MNVATKERDSLFMLLGSMLLVAAVDFRHSPVSLRTRGTCQAEIASSSNLWGICDIRSFNGAEQHAIAMVLGVFLTSSDLICQSLGEAMYNRWQEVGTVNVYTGAVFRGQEQVYGFAGGDGKSFLDGIGESPHYHDTLEFADTYIEEEIHSITGEDHGELMYEFLRERCTMDLAEEQSRRLVAVSRGRKSMIALLLAEVKP